jgi:hypothetical protein
MKLELWTMHSDSGYVPSYGTQSAYFVPSAKIPQDEDLDLVTVLDGDLFRKIKKGDLVNGVPFSRRMGVCNYQGRRGDIEVPEGFSVVVLQDEHICTCNDNEPVAFILNAEEDVAP